MKFIYIDYGKNFINEIKKREPNQETIIVFSDYFLKNSYMKTREKNIYNRKNDTYRSKKTSYSF